MEKMVSGFGFVMFCLFFFVGFVVGNVWFWGCVPSLAIMLFGAWFEE